MYRVNPQKGFTLFEVLIYIALFTVMIGGGVLAAFSIFKNGSRTQTGIQREADLNFALRKLDWVISESDVTSPVNIVSGVTVSNTLIANRDGLQYHVRAENGAILVEDEPITGPSINVSDIDFVRDNDDPDVLSITITADDEVIGPITRYIR